MAKKKVPYKLIITIIIIAVLAFLFFRFGMKIDQVSTFHVGVKSDKQSVLGDAAYSPEVILNGMVVYMPYFTDFYEYPIDVRSVKYKTFNALTKDGLDFSVSSTLVYQVNINKVGTLYKNYRKPLVQVDSIDLKQIVHAAYIQAISTFTGDSLIASRPLLDNMVNSTLTERLDKMGLTYNSVSTSVEPPLVLKNIITQRAIAVQSQILIEDQKKKAYAVKFADSLANSALTPLAIQKMFIEKWDGKLSGKEDLPQAYKDINK